MHFPRHPVLPVSQSHTLDSGELWTLLLLGDVGSPGTAWEQSASSSF